MEAPKDPRPESVHFRVTQNGRKSDFVSFFDRFWTKNQMSVAKYRGLVLEDGVEHIFPLHNVDQLWDGDCSWPILAPGAAGTWVGAGIKVAPLDL